MLMQFVKELEKRRPLTVLLQSFEQLFQKDSNSQVRFSDESFAALLTFLEKGEVSFRQVAIQAGARWSSSSQKILLRNSIAKRGFLTPSCLWAFNRLRGNPEVFFKDLRSPEMSLMQIILMRETDPTRAVPFLIQRFLNRRDVPEELKMASRLCIMNILDSGVSPDHVRYLRSRYPGFEDLCLWRPRAPKLDPDLEADVNTKIGDFHQLVRSVRDTKELSSLTRTVYLVSLFHVPLTTREWRTLLLSRTDRVFFQKLRPTGLLETFGDGLILSTEPSKQTMVKKFLYDSYSVARESVHRYRAESLREERQKQVRKKELDRQALERLPDGVISIERCGFLYYINAAAESMLSENEMLRERLFGCVPLDAALRGYSRERVLARITSTINDNGDETQIFGDRVTMKIGPKRYEVELGPQVIILRDTTDQYLINQEIGRLYRHEFKAALDVMDVGIESARQLFKDSRLKEGLDFLDQVAQKRSNLCSMLEERIDFIRLHSDAFRIRPVRVNFNLVVDRCVNNYRESAAAKRVTIMSDHLDQPMIVVKGEERYLLRALDNVIRNSVKFCYPDSLITVSLTTDTQGGLVRVQDAGPGIPKENLHKIFQLGFSTGGTGRGLYLARKIAEAHGGRIDVESTPGKGAQFTLRVPVLKE
jgi:signal transduction histidine kinase